MITFFLPKKWFKNENLILKHLKIIRQSAYVFLFVFFKCTFLSFFLQLSFDACIYADQ